MKTVIHWDFWEVLWEILKLMEKILVMQNTKEHYGVDKKKPAEYDYSRLFYFKN
jgi:hypothetical protein